ncbi:NADH-quinone oxidoreductase subunit D [Lepagella muris]|jgi:NADH-quinone oxidoreductase subunit C/D|uniref:NADH-quinone oxidoreductase subunit D n=1 Tax=Lepagella muris TaxID=3032870 RepID=A0AC61RI95_9BACT|nr:NADH-quinone oxidoreductase subunit D [Lepagella muris]ROT05570.1 NADH-quinone oxidoreductase subunit D [Muribaculaceae bacterium Isolate-037 (Harlan)]TGY78037.1 NADH-quinone oxidoreductase subunit D [Lepagella muris]THG51618.1 NADH-quinone oxidoreductase subunit D [Bacteroidales bacterium]TKC63252.1 NADH-quinone oxidoreductase subunit D [Bacteroidales bacterium]
MSDIKEKISSILPGAVFTEGETLMVTVEEKDWHSFAKALKETRGLEFDVLTAVVGMDWKDSLGVVYYLTSTSRNWEVISVKVAVADRENPMIHSVSDLWKVANFQEREVFDFYGIKFINHPDMRRFFLRNDWKGYPLRKDYDADPKLNPIPAEDEQNEDDTVSYVEDASGKVKAVPGKVFEEDDYVVNIGPQHPSTHGVMRFRAAVDGETVKKVDVVSGYIHRGIEKLCEGMTYPQILHFTDRMDYMSAHQNRHCLCMCIEKAMGLEIPRRAEVIRVMMDELMRISSHLLSFGCTAMDLGATTAFFYGFREREMVLDIFEKTCGARMSMNYNVIGGVIADLHPDFVKDVKELIRIMPERLKEYHKVFSGNLIAKNRLKKVGHLSKEDAINYAITGPSGRGSNWSCDCRKKHPYSIYSELDFEEVLETGCDSYSRYMVRMKEIEQSCKILEQLVDRIPEGDIRAQVPKVVKLPAGNWYQQVEASRGTFGVYIESDGGKNPYRVHFQSPCFNLVGVMDLTCSGYMIADLITIGAALDFVIPDIDR